jgi:hypothetical protein
MLTEVASLVGGLLGESKGLFRFIQAEAPTGHVMAGLSDSSRYSACCSLIALLREP